MTNRVKLFLDDEREPVHCFWMESPFYTQQWKIVRNYAQFVDFISAHGLPELISFDHDLGEDKSGFDCAKWLVNYCLDHDIAAVRFLVHSKNPVGGGNIESLLSGFNRRNLK